MEADSPERSLDEDLAAAFEGEFGSDEEQAAPEERFEDGGEGGKEGDAEGGSDSSGNSSDLDLDEVAEEAYAEYEAAKEEAAGSGTGGAVRLKHLHGNAEVVVSPQEAERIRRDTVTRLLNKKRLILILDLDHTLLNSVHTGEVDADAAPRLAELQAREQEANLGPRRLLHCLVDKKLWTKLRPGVFEFLEGLRDSYEMHIYTMGDKAYAAEVRRLLDPGGRLFTSVIAKDHSTTTTAKHLDVLLSADELALVLDDTELVWPGHKRNLLQIERYHFFPSDLRKWRADGTALLEQGRDEDPTEGALATHMRVLRAVHARFFSKEDPSLPPLEQRDVRDVLAEHRARILQDRDPRQEPLWQLAEGLGARCLPSISPATTHVVAAAGGTEKVHQARAQGKAVVTPAWLQACGFRWQRLPEADFLLGDLGPGGSRGGGSSAAKAPADANGGGGSGGKQLSPEEELRVVMAVAGGGGGAADG
ncbi:hypothetical protein GPECTOR_7g960 [Gonium pectorale]|uniref:protein-serine/threonine phosphatase n=1 Tax=Gonium pectorale TaxID=33097 RepID=A0A150GVX7_GONPE|nr:hypothetical protein GPECTOR_7g960 [Gonium pectorale]|eukprot:KXZ53510.1 hypothetical protein GPECTOR_7g960 [Gonium pectorale]